MKNNIESEKVGNRKFIIEIRFQAKASMLDKKGFITEALEKENIFGQSFWEIGQEVILRDSDDKEKATNVIIVSHNRYSYISTNISSVEDYFNKFEKVRKAVTDVLGKLVILRIGCRIIGSYKTKSTTFAELLKTFTAQFPSTYLLKDYNPKDLSFTLVYENGRYLIGPLSEKDQFYEKEFPSDKYKKHVGVCIDTDNFVTNEVKSIDDKQIVKDVYEMSLSVEKDLSNKLCDL